ncbi:hypothetical protein HCN56_21000, partial [Streptomyces lonarensis]|nr:hypothetical protein [Streptomyces lonarensis]
MQRPFRRAVLVALAATAALTAAAPALAVPAPALRDPVVPDETGTPAGAPPPE